LIIMKPEPYLRPLRVVAFLAFAIPGLLLAHDYVTGALASPFRTIVQETGLWSIRMLVLGLMIAPLRDIAGWTWPLALRRMIGLYAAFYTLVHVVAWTRQYGFDWPFLLAEVSRLWLLVGAVSAAALLLLASTSASVMHRWLGPELWGRIHRLVYTAAVMALVHYAMARGLTRIEVAVDGVLILVALAWRQVALRRKKVKPAAAPSATA
jgi:sulfoxide reductase heme-binding subunit YedZ